VMNLVGSKPRLHATELHKVIRRSLIENDDREATIHFIRESLRLTELCYYDERRQSFLFPRGLPTKDHSALTADWQKKIAKFDYFPEAAFYRFTVRLLTLGYVLLDEKQPAYARWSIIACTGEDQSVKVAVIARPDDGELEFRVASSTQQAKGWDLAELLYKIFWVECMKRKGPMPKEVFDSLAHGEVDHAEAGGSAANSSTESGVAVSQPTVNNTGNLETLVTDDYTSFTWRGLTFHFSKGQQKEVIKCLHEAMLKGRHSLAQETIALKIGAAPDNFVLGHVFREKKNERTGKREYHPAWKTLIVRAEKGIYRMVPESE